MLEVHWPMGTPAVSELVVAELGQCCQGPDAPELPVPDSWCHGSVLVLVMGSRVLAQCQQWAGPTFPLRRESAWNFHLPKDP